MLEDQSIEKIIQNIQSSKLSIKELMEYYLDRIEKYNTDLNAIVGVVLIVGLMFLVVNIIIDILIALINPKVRLS